MGPTQSKPASRAPVKSSPPGDIDYDARKSFYRSKDVAEDYDRHRFKSKKRQRRNVRKWRAIQKALALTEGVERLLDIPCGTGRFTDELLGEGYRVIGSDISREMMEVGLRERVGAKGLLGFVQSDAEHLPFPDDAVDCVLCIRFFLHVDGPTRVRILREMKRASRRWVLVDYRHRYTLRWALWRTRQALGRTSERFERVTRAQIEDEIEAAGLKLVKVVPVELAFSDKWIVLAEVPQG